MTSPIQDARNLRKLSRHDEAAAVLIEAARRGGLDPLQLTEAGRLLDKLVEAEQVAAPKLRVHLLGQVTTSWLRPALVATAWGRRQPAVVTEGGFDQIFQDLLTLQPGEVDVVVLFPWHPRLLGAAGSVADRVDAELSFWRQCWERASALGVKLIQVGYDLEGPGPLGAAISGLQGGPVHLIRAMNLALREALPRGAAFVDLEQVAGAFGRDRFYDRRRWFWTRQPFSEAALAPLSAAIYAAVRAVTTGPKKVLVLDLDNTLWGGVVGETGPLGVELGLGPDGEAFLAFQAWCKALSERGVVLAVASKNERDDARAPFEQNPHMVLRLSDLAAFEAHWEPKSVSLRRIADLLSLGLDSFVFFDDNPAEREQIRQALPEVEVVEVPPDPAGYIPAIEAGGWFETTGLTDEDAARSQQYQAEHQRREAESSFTNLEDYLRSLEMVADIRTIDDADLPRVVQLLGKTNQWNLTTRRHSAAAVEEMLATPGTVAFTLRLRDRFGDHGLVAVLIAVPEGEAALRIDTWLMSCRVIARTAEHLALRHLVEAARSRGVATLIGDYLPTKKNRQVAELYAGFGFTQAGEAPGGEGGGRYVAHLDTLELPRTFVQT